MYRKHLCLFLLLISPLLPPKPSSAQANIISSIPNKGIFLYAEKNRFFYRNFTLQINKQFIHFPAWRHESDSEYVPKLYYVDLNKDNKKEVAIILTVIHDLDKLEQEAHIIQKVNGLYQELAMKGPENTVREKVSMRINGKQLILNIDKENHIFHTDKLKIPTEQVFPKPSVGPEIRYNIDQSKLISYVDIRISPSTTVGKVKITYKMMYYTVVDDQVDFVPVND